MILSIVGQRFAGKDNYLPGIVPGTPVLLVREPDNPADANAIAVWINGERVGFIPKKDNVALARAMDKAKRVATIGEDSASSRITMNATFRRSPNSAYPQVEVDL